MAYIGRQLVRGQNRVLDDISSSFNGSTTAFNLTVSSSSSPPASVNQLWIILGGVLQKPGTDFTVADAVLTFTTAPASTLSFWGMIQGDTSDINSPADASVTPSKIANSGDFAFPADVRFKDADGSHYVGLQAPSTVSSNLVWTLPAADGSANQLLKTDGSGALGWASDTQSNLLDEDNMSSNSATQPASQQSIKAYADTKAVLTGSTNNTITTVTGAHAIQGEANLTYDGTTLLSNADTAGLTLRDSSAYAANTGCQISFQGKDSNEATKAFAAIKGLSVSADNGQLRFQTRTGGTLYDRLTILADGNVGIGTVSPHAAGGQTHLTINQPASGTQVAGIHLQIGGSSKGTILSYPSNDEGLRLTTFDAGKDITFYKNVSSSDTILGRFYNEGNFEISDGDLVIGTSGHGIDFGATSDNAGHSSELLDEYEEGEYIPSVSANITLNTTYRTWSYTRIGRQVTIKGLFLCSAVSGTDNIALGLPFNAANLTGTANAGPGATMWNNVTGATAGVASYIQNSGTELRFYILTEGTSGWARMANDDIATNTEIYVTHTYFVA